MKKVFDFAEVGYDCIAESHRVLHCYIRFMMRKYKLGIFDHSTFSYCPNYYQYLSHVNAILLLARESSYYGNNNILYHSTNCKEIDILVKRYVLKTYKLNLYYSDKFKPKKNNFYKPFKINFISFIKNIFFDLKKSNINNKFIHIKKNENSILILSHGALVSNILEPYSFLPKELIKFLKHKNLNSIYIMPNQIGLSYIERFTNSFRILNKIFSVIFIKDKISISSIEFIFSVYYQDFYKDKLKKYFIKNNIKKIVSSYIDIRYEPIYYKAARDLNIKYYIYDYSLGYPLKDSRFLRYFPDTRKYANVIFCNSEFRMAQYKKASSFLEKKPIFASHICPQIQFCINKKVLIPQDIKKLKIGIVDNIFADDMILKYEDSYSLFRELKTIDFKLQFILQSKRGKLLDILKELNINVPYIIPRKGDFSLIKNADFIISIGWQSTALKAAYFFKKPLLFYSKNGYPYENHTFSFDDQINQLINEKCNSLWLNQTSFKKEFNKIINNKDQFQKVKDNSTKLLNNIGFYQRKIEEYFDQYF